MECYSRKNMLVLDNLAYASVDKELTASVSITDTAGRAQLGGYDRADTAVRIRQGRYAGQTWPGRRGRSDTEGTSGGDSYIKKRSLIPVKGVTLRGCFIHVR